VTDPHTSLIEQIAAANEQAMEEFYRLFQTSVYAFALRRLSEPADAADVLNETMLEVWRHAGRYEGRAKVKTWLLGIANHKVMDKLRQRGRHPETSDETDIPDDDSPAPDVSLAGNEYAEFVRRCLDKLQDNHRQVVHLAFYQELSYPEIAAILECPEGTVKTRMFHARQLLKRCISMLLGD
jgi:RNA polymerase sigma-70 factor (ECF subfamily)